MMDLALTGPVSAAWRRAVLLGLTILLGLSFGLPDLSAQAASPAPGTPQAGASASTEPFPVKPYADSEFPDWLRGIRRFETLAIGSFPISFLYVNLIYDVGRYIGKVSSGASDAASYAPFLFAPTNKPANTQEETNGLILASVGVALGVAIGDLIIGLIAQADAEARAKSAAIPLVPSPSMSVTPLQDPGTPASGEAATGTGPNGPPAEVAP